MRARLASTALGSAALAAGSPAPMPSMDRDHVCAPRPGAAGPPAPPQPLIPAGALPGQCRSCPVDPAPHQPRGHRSGWCAQGARAGWDVRSFTRTGAVSTGDSRCRCAGTCCHEHRGEHEVGREETACGAQRALCWRQRVPQGRAPSRHHCAAHASACPCPAVPLPALPHSGSAPQPTRPAGLGRGATWGHKGRAQGTRGAGQRAGSVHCGAVLGAFSAAGAAACAALVHSAVPVPVPEVNWCGASTAAVLVLSSVPVLVLRAVLVLGAVPVLSAMPVRGAVPDAVPVSVLGAVPVPGAVPGAVLVPGAARHGQ